MPDRARVVIALPDSTECGTVAEWLIASGFEPIKRPTTRTAAEEMEQRAFDLLITDVAFAFRSGLHAAARRRNPQTPTILIGNSINEPAEALSGQTMYLARPIDRALLICFVTMAIIDARPARQSMRKPVNRVTAVVNGVPTHIIDVSNEGLRLEVPPTRRVLLPPYFSVQVPMLGVAVSVKRMWTRPAATPGESDAIWYGGALALNRTRIEQAWRMLVDTIPTAGRGAPSIDQID
jgi:AmiR/NasT family two-component response regulator